MTPNNPAKKILLVDDDAGLLRLLSIRLKACGFDIKAVESAEAALATLGVYRPHAIITDLRMPGMDGLTLFDAVHRDYPTLPVIVLTAHGNIPDAIKATQQGVFGYLTKPYDTADLIALVEKAVNNGHQDQQTATGQPNNDWRAEIITRSPAMEDFLQQAHLVAASDVSVFISGPSGSGKELLAQAIHKASARAGQPFIAVNCGAIPEPLLESEFFGHVKGAFTNAHRDHNGLFQAAEGGTLFLDEIGDMPVSLQVKLLRVLEERQVRPVGSTQSIPIDVRIISATHRDLDDARAAGEFREDLYYRLNVVSLSIPPLAERREDIPLLANHFLQRLARRHNRRVNAFSPEAMQLLVSAHWAGNVRQLLNVVEQTVALSTTPIIPATLIQRAIREDLPAIETYDEARRRFERDYLTRLLRLTGGNVSQAARLAKRNRTEFYRLLSRHDIEPAAFKTLDTDQSG